VGVVCQKVPAGSWRLRTLLNNSRTIFHEYMIHCLY
jgi:hypothetical protein